MADTQEVKPEMNEVFGMIDAALKFDPEVAQGKEGVYQFDLTGDEESTTYQIILDEEPRTVQGEEKEADCTLTLTADDFKELVAGNLNPTGAFMQGKLTIKGNMGLALKMQTVLNSFSF